MPKINKANRQVCDLDIRSIDKKPFLFFNTANVTTQDFTDALVYAKAKGSRKIGFNDPIQGTATIEAQVYPFELYSLFSDGTIESTAAYAKKITVKSTTAGELAITDTVLSGSVFVYAKGDFAGKVIEGTFADKKFTATTSSAIVVDTEYEVGYIAIKNSGVRKISINDKKLPKAYYITMNTVEKDEDDNLSTFKMVFYKAQPQRNFSLSQSSEGDPATITLSFDLLEDKEGNFVDMIELEDEDEDV